MHILEKISHFTFFAVSQALQKGRRVNPSDKYGQPCLLDPQPPTTFSDVRASRLPLGEGCPYLSRFSAAADKFQNI